MIPVEPLPSRKVLQRAKRLASGRQLWLLNKHGWLELRSTPDLNAEILNSAADQAIKQSMREEQEARGEDT